MEDSEIVELFISRDSGAVEESLRKYGGYCRRLAEGILRDAGDAAECVDDALMRAWQSIPPQRPRRLGAYLGKLTRNLALDRLDARSAQKRGGGEPEAAIEELEECVPAQGDVEDRVILADTLNVFLASLKPLERQVFLRRYWSAEPVGEIARSLGLSGSRVTSMLFRARKRLRKALEEELL